MTVSVTQLANFIKAMFESETLLFDIQVQGELTNVKPSKNGTYFSLKDEASQIDCFTFSSLPLAGGQIVTVTGRPNYLTKYGKISFFVTKVSQTEKQGNARLRFLELREKLAKEGCFENHRALSRLPQRIGVVSSGYGAVIHDILRVLQRRNPTVDVVLYPVQVQGEKAPAEIARAVRFFSNYAVDTVVVARGGGSDEDLSAFNDEQVVRAIFECRRPVISAVGHETNVTLADEAADVRASTPSVAAELITAETSFVREEVLRQAERLRDSVQNRFDRVYYKLRSYVAQCQAGTQKKCIFCVSNVRRLAQRSESAVVQKYQAQSQATQVALARIRAKNPLQLLADGYAVVWKGQERIRSADRLHPGEEVTLRFAEGKARAKIIETEQKV